MRTFVLCQPFALIVFTIIVVFGTHVTSGQNWTNADVSTTLPPENVAGESPVPFAVVPAQPVAYQIPVSETVNKSPAFAQDDLRPLVMRLTLATVVVLSGCGLAILAGRRFFGVQSHGFSNSTLQAICTLRVSPRAFVSLVKACDQTLVVGHDATGLRSMVMLPTSFQDELETQVHGLGSSGAEPSDTLTKLRSLVNADQARGAYEQHGV